MRIEPKNWSDFQHYKDRDPSWIKLHKRLLDDFDFHSLPLASRALAPMLWLLCSEAKDGVFEGTEQKASFRLHMTVGELNDALMPLIEAKFFSLERVDSELIARPEHHAIPEKKEESREQVEKQEQTEVEAAFAESLLAYNRIASELKWPQAGSLNRSRKSKLAKRLTEVGGLGGWRAAMAKARASPWLRGDIPRGKGYESWAPDLDFFLQQSTFTKLMEGKYDQRGRVQSTGFDALREGASRAAGLDPRQGQGMEGHPDELQRLAISSSS